MQNELIPLSPGHHAEVDAIIDNISPDDYRPAGIIIDGWYVDEETGEVLGLVEAKPEFRVTDENSCNWVLEKILNAESDVLSIDQTPAVIAARAILENADKMRKERQRRVDYLHTRFTPELAEYARPLLAGRSTKTWKTVWGSIGFRTVPGGLRVKDASMALNVAKEERFTNAVKVTEAFQISLLTDEQKAYIISKLESQPSNSNSFGSQAFEIKLDTETVTVKSGAGK